jgi:hypothetical protein
MHKTIQLINEVVRRNGIRIRILTSKDMQQQIEKTIARQKIITTKSGEGQEDGRGVVVIGNKGKLEIHLIDSSQQQERLLTKVSFLIVDSKISLIEELRRAQSYECFSHHSPTIQRWMAWSIPAR